MKTVALATICALGALAACGSPSGGSSGSTGSPAAASGGSTGAGAAGASGGSNGGGSSTGKASTAGASTGAGAGSSSGGNGASGSSGSASAGTNGGSSSGGNGSSSTNGGSSNGGGSGGLVTLNGAVAKGPFISGSTVVVSPVDASGNPSGQQFTTETSDALGDFTVQFSYQGPVFLQGTGYYYNEVTGNLAGSSLTLDAYANIAQAGSQDAYINTVTHLAHDRVQTLLQGGGLTVPQAVSQAEGELEAALPIGGTGFDAGVSGTQMNLLTGDTNGNAYLFATSAVFAEAAVQNAGSNSVEAELQSLLNGTSLAFAPDGSVPAGTIADLQKAEQTVEPDGVMASMGTYFASAGSAVTVPNLNRALDSDLDGVPNLTDTCVLQANADQTVVPSGLCAYHHVAVANPDFPDGGAGAPQAISPSYVVGDVNGDGVADLVAVGNTVAVFFGADGGAPGVPVTTNLASALGLPSGATVQSMIGELRDPNNDGHADLVLNYTVYQLSGTTSVNWAYLAYLPGDGTGNFGAPVVLSQIDLSTLYQWPADAGLPPFPVSQFDLSGGWSNTGGRGLVGLPSSNGVNVPGGVLAIAAPLLPDGGGFGPETLITYDNSTVTACAPGCPTSCTPAPADAGYCPADCPANCTMPPDGGSWCPDYCPPSCSPTGQPTCPTGCPSTCNAVPDGGTACAKDCPEPDSTCVVWTSGDACPANCPPGQTNPPPGCPANCTGNSPNPVCMQGCTNDPNDKTHPPCQGGTACFCPTDCPSPSTCVANACPTGCPTSCTPTGETTCTNCEDTYLKGYGPGEPSSCGGMGSTGPTACLCPNGCPSSCAEPQMGICGGPYTSSPGSPCSCGNDCTSGCTQAPAGSCPAGCPSSCWSQNNQTKSPPTPVNGLAVGDFNGDGALDFAISVGAGNFGGGSGGPPVGPQGGIWVLLNDGNGNFTASEVAASGAASGPVTGVVAADFDGDGKVDLAVADACGTSTDWVAYVAYGDGTGGFGNVLTVDVPNPVPPGGPGGSGSCAGNFPYLFSAADVDGDGKADLVIGSQVLGSLGRTFGPPVALLASSGGGSVSGGGASVGNGLSIGSWAVLDFNGDGRDDLISGTVLFLDDPPGYQSW